MALALTLLIGDVLSGCTRGADQQPQAQPEPAESAIAGVVTASDTGQPLTDVIVGFYNAAGESVGPGTKTDSRGRYRAALPPGSYMIYVNVPSTERPRGWNGYAPTWTDGSPVTPDRATLVLAAGETLEYNAVLPPVRPAYGRVMTAGGPGLPESGGNVGALDPRSGKGFGEPLPPDGRFTLWLPDGEWMVQVAVAGYQPGYSPKFAVSGGAVTIPDITIYPG